MTAVAAYEIAAVPDEAAAPITIEPPAIDDVAPPAATPDAAKLPVAATLKPAEPNDVATDAARAAEVAETVACPVAADEAAINAVPTPATAAEPVADTDTGISATPDAAATPEPDAK